jgi:ribose transport system substrate-binding protein
MLSKFFYSKIALFFLLCVSLHSQDIKTIAFAQDTLANDFRKAQVMEAKEAAKKYDNVKFIYTDANGRTSLLISQIDDLIKQKVDALIVGTNDADSVVSVVKKAHEAGIVVIILDRGINGTDYTTFINSDNIKIGSIGAKYIAKRLNGKGKVLLFEGLQKADVTKLRSKGFMDEISRHKGIEVIKRTGNYLRRDAIVEMEKLLAEGIRVDAIFSESDSMVSGARSALIRHKIDPSSIITVGCDYTSEAREAIRKGTQTGSILFPLGGDESIDTIVKVFSGKKVKKHIVIPVKLVTKENVELVKPIF